MTPMTGKDWRWSIPPISGACARRGVQPRVVELRPIGKPAQSGERDAQAQRVLCRRVGGPGCGPCRLRPPRGKQVQKRRTREGHTPERGLLEVKSTGDDALTLAEPSALGQRASSLPLPSSSSDPLHRTSPGQIAGIFRHRAVFGLRFLRGLGGHRATLPQETVGSHARWNL